VSPSARLVALAALGAVVGACDESQVWHEPDLQFDRMQLQPRIDPFDKGMSAPPPFTVARGLGPAEGRPRVTRALLDHGRTAFERTCAACHGLRGDGVSVVARKMVLRPPPSFLEARVRGLSDEQVHLIVERGYGLMPPYASFLTRDERWAVVGYLRALETALAVDVRTLPASMRAELAKEAP
jgi:mono/diheme cytochrome c family protein